MLLYIDPREGSKTFLPDFPESQELLLDGGDIAFFGNGPDDTPWFIGIEHKQVGDLVNCIKSGRLTGTQLPEMRKLYDLSVLLIEGAYEPNFKEPLHDDSFRVWIPRGAGYGTQFGFGFRPLDNFLTSVEVFSSLAGRPCIVKRAKNHKESVEIIKNLYHMFQKKWEDHTAFRNIDATKMQRLPCTVDLLGTKPEDEGYPKLILRKALFQIDRIGWNEAGIIADKFGTVENVVLASQKDFEELDRIGSALAKRVFETFHGYSDVPKKKGRRKNAEK